MDTLRKIFPISFRYSGSVAELIVGILIYLVGGAIAGYLIGFLHILPFVDSIVSLLGYLLGLYSSVGIIVEILAFLNVLK